MSWAVLWSIAMNIAKKICWIWMVSIQYGPHANQGIKEIALFFATGLLKCSSSWDL